MPIKRFSVSDMIRKRKNDKESEMIEQLDIGLKNNQIQNLTDSYQIEIKRSEAFLQVLGHCVSMPDYPSSHLWMLSLFFSYNLSL